ncbi:transposase [Priestia megaterium]
MLVRKNIVYIAKICYYVSAHAFYSKKPPVLNCTPIVRQRNSNDWGAFMSRHTFEDKLKAIDLYLNKRNSYRETAKLMSATKSDIIKWVALYQKHGEKGLQPTYTNYSVKFKMDVLTYMEKTGASIREASYVFNIPSYSTVAKWKRTFEEQGKDGLFPKKRSRPKMKKKPTENLDTDKTNEELLKENEYLRMEIAYLKKLNALVQASRESKSEKKPK